MLARTLPYALITKSCDNTYSRACDALVVLLQLLRYFKFKLVEPEAHVERSTTESPPKASSSRHKRAMKPVDGYVSDSDSGAPSYVL